MLNILDFGARGDGKFMNTQAFANAIEAAAKTGEALNIPAGTFLTGTINLQGVSLHLDAGAVIKGSPDLADYPVQDFFHNEMGPLRALIVNMNHDNVSITGSGIIDLNGHAFYDTTTMNVPATLVPMTESQMAECTYSIGERPNQCIFFYDCKNIEVSGITILDAPCWTMSFNACEKIRLANLNIDTDLNIPNDDGIHLCSCKGATITGCHISSGDDCIALSCITDWDRPCEDVVITNCVMKSCSKTIVLGYVYSTIRNVLISNCIIHESNRGLCIMCHDQCALVENVRVSNCIIDTRIRAGNWWGNGEPILMMAVDHDRLLPADQKHTATPGCAIRNVHLDNITCTGENAIGIVGTDGNIQDISLHNLQYTRKPSQNLPLKGSSFDLSPSLTQCSVPENCGILITGAKNVDLQNVTTGTCRIIQEA